MFRLSGNSGLLQNEGVTEDRADGVHLSLLTILEQKFGRMPGELVQPIRTIQDVARLQNVIRHAVTIAKIDELLL